MARNFQSPSKRRFQCNGSQKGTVVPYVAFQSPSKRRFQCNKRGEKTCLIQFIMPFSLLVSGDFNVTWHIVCPGDYIINFQSPSKRRFQCNRGEIYMAWEYRNFQSPSKRRFQCNQWYGQASLL